jgi:hypothetical protein
VLQGAAATHAKVRALRFDSVSRRRDNFHQYRFIMLAVTTLTLKADRFAWKHARHEDGLRPAYDALAIVVQGGDNALLDRGGLDT